MTTLGRFEMGGSVLQKHLVRRRQETVLAGQTRVFPAGVLRPADLVTCDIPGHHLALGVPTQTGGPSSTTGYFGGRKGAAVTVAVALRPDGSVSASCNVGTLLPRVPQWLKAVETRTLDRVFGHARPIHTATIWYPHKVAVIFEFKRVVICGACSAPSNALLPRGRVIRVSYDRRTHQPGNAMQFCESRGSSPARGLCLRR